MTPAKVHHLTGIPWADLVALSTSVGRYYSSFDSQIVYASGKKPTKLRHIDNPRKPLQKVQKRILQVILRSSRLPEHMYGAKRGGSIIDHATRHERQECVLTIDLASCYPRTSYPRVYEEFIKTFRCIPDVASVLTKLTTFQRRLPQGAATSGYLAHLVLKPLFLDMKALVAKHGLRLSFFMDDIAISGRTGAVHAVIQPVVRLIQAQGFSISTKKKHLMVGAERKVTGLDVGERVAIPQSYLSAVETDLVIAINSGEMTEPQRASLQGKIRWIRQVSPEKADVLEELLGLAPHAEAGPELKFLRNFPCTHSTKCRAPRWAPTIARGSQSALLDSTRRSA